MIHQEAQVVVTQGIRTNHRKDEAASDLGPFEQRKHQDCESDRRKEQRGRESDDHRDRYREDRDKDKGFRDRYQHGSDDTLHEDGRREEKGGRRDDARRHHGEERDRRNRDRDLQDEDGRKEERGSYRREDRVRHNDRHSPHYEDRFRYRDRRRKEGFRDGERGRYADEDEDSHGEEDRHRKHKRDRYEKDDEIQVDPKRPEEDSDFAKESRKRENEVHRKEVLRKEERSESEGHANGYLDKAKGTKRKGKGGEEEMGKEREANGVTQQTRSNSEVEKSSTRIPAKAEQAAPGRTGGVYIPPFKLAQMMKDIQDKSSAEYQRMTWDALRKSINGLVNKVNASNIKNIIPELFSENLIRGRGLFARSCMKSQMASPSFTHVFAALVAVVNTKFPELGELLLKRVILQFRRALRRNDKPLLLAATKFIAHLVNQQVAHEVVALEILMVLLENPTDDSVEVAVGFVKECGAMLQDLAPQGLHSIFEQFRGILHEGEIDKRVQFMIEGLFAIRKANFQGHPAVLPELDLVEQEDQLTHEISLDGQMDEEKVLDVFKVDPSFLENEKKYEAIKNDILGEESEDDSEGASNSEDDSEEDEDGDSEDEDQRIQIKDETETNLVNLRRTIYLTIMSSVDFEEAGHKLLKIKLEAGQEMELNVMLLECCSQERTYLRYYGLLGQRFCMLNRIYQVNFDECFMKQYSMIHRLETNKLRNVAKFFAHLLATDALPWNVLAYIRLTEEDTTSSSRIFIKILFQELSEHLGLRKLNERLNDPMVQESFEGIFPKDNPKNTRFAINFFTSIGLGGITDSLREYLKNMPRLIMQQQKPIESESESEEHSESSDTSGSESSSSESDSDSSDISESTSEQEDSDDNKRKKRKKG